MKMTMMQDARPKAVYDRDNHRFIIKAIAKSKLTLPDVFRAIKRCHVPGHGIITWRFLAEFCNISQSDAFKVAYLTKGDGYIIRKALNPYLVIDDAENVAYFYDYDHKPEDAASVHIGPKLINGEINTQTITEKVPAKVATRVLVKSPFSTQLLMRLTPVNGYLLGVRDVVIAQPNATYEVTATAGTLTDLLKKLHFVAMEPGEASLTIMVDDRAGEIGSKVSATIKLNVLEGVKISVPELHIPDAPKATLLEESSFEAITVSDEDDKIMQLRITPFGCKIINFKNFLEPLVPGKVRNIYGRPETINSDIANLSIIPFQENAQIGVELICGTTKILQYVVFDVETPTQDEEGEEPEGGDDQNPEEGQPEDAEQVPNDSQLPTPEDAPSVQSDEAEVQAEAALQSETGVIFTSSVESISAPKNTEVPFPAYLQGDPGANVIIGIKPIRCSIVFPDGDTIPHNAVYNTEGSLEDINAIITELKVITGTKDGRIDLTVGNTLSALPVNIVAAPAE